MDTTSLFRCDACLRETWHDVQLKSVPFDWRPIRIEGRKFILCDHCAKLAGPNGQDIAPALCNLFVERGINLRVCKAQWNIGTGEGPSPG
jgi:hypothetical protein